MANKDRQVTRNTTGYLSSSSPSKSSYQVYEKSTQKMSGPGPWKDTRMNVTLEKTTKLTVEVERTGSSENRRIGQNNGYSSRGYICYTCDTPGHTSTYCWKR